MGREEMLKNVPIFSELGRRDLERLGQGGRGHNQGGRPGGRLLRD